MDTRAEFRTVDGGDVPIEVNSHSMTSSRYVDRSRLGEHDEWQPSANPMKMGRVVRVSDSIEDNARAGADCMKHRSSFRDVNKPESGRESGVCFTSPFCNSNGPLTTRRGDR